MRRTLGAELSHMLAARGVEVVFGVPGVHNQEMYRGIAEAGITHVLARHEQGAGFMADGYARASGKPGVAYVISGPGLCNILTPMGQAYSDSIPMLVLSSGLDATSARQGQLHQMRDQAGAAACVCEWSEVAETGQAAFDLIDRAFEQFSTARARPKHVQVPIRLLESPVAPAPPPIAAANPATASENDILAVVSLLETAQRPLLILGGGARGDTWRQLAAQIGAAVFTTHAGRGRVGTDYPLDFGATLARPDSAEVIANADLVLAIGTELGEVDLWRDHLGNAAPLVRIDIDPEVLADGHRSRTKLLADAGNFAEAFSKAIKNLSPATGWSERKIRRTRARWRAEADADRPGILPYCEALHAALPAETMIYSDMTQFAYVARETWPMAKPGHWHHPHGFGTLGYALPAGIGGAVARGGTGGRCLPTIVIAGDYGFQYSMAELGVAVELELPLPILVWDNEKLKEIEDRMQSAQIAPIATTTRNPDFPALAEAFGAASVRVSSPEDTAKAAVSALTASRPTLIHVTPNRGTTDPHH